MVRALGVLGCRGHQLRHGRLLAFGDGTLLLVTVRWIVRLFVLGPELAKREKSWLKYLTLLINYTSPCRHGQAETR